MWNPVLKIALRSLQREKSYVLVIVVGFATGIACFIAAIFYLSSELNYDRHFSNYQNIYRVATERRVGSNFQYTAMGSPQAGPIFLSDFPAVQSFVRFAPSPPLALNLEQIDSRDWDTIYHTDANVFDFFNHEIIFGNPESALLNPESIAISRSFSNYYFGDSNPIGEVIREAEKDYTVTLVFEDLPANTHLKYDALLPWDDDLFPFMNYEGPQRQALMFLAQTHYTYLEMVDGFNPSQFREISEEYVSTHLSDFVSSTDMQVTFSLEPLADIHFGSTTARDHARGNHSSVLILAALASSVLIIASLNYTSLALARVQSRTREIGMCRILGATKLQLVLQLLLESFAFITLALIFGTGLLYMVFQLDSVARFPGIATGMDQLFSTSNAVMGIFACVILSLLTGLYPAFTLLAKQPLDTFSVSATSRTSNLSSYKATLLIQLTLSVIIITFSAQMYAQLVYLNERPLGFDKYNKITVEVKGLETIRRLNAFISALESRNDIVGATVTVDLANGHPIISTPMVETEDGSFRSMNINHITADDRFLDVMGIELVSGRNLDANDPNDFGRTNLVNETLVRELGWTQPLGKRVGTWQVTGVVADFNFKSLHQAVEPMVIRLDNENLERATPLTGSRMRRTVIISVREANLEETLQYIREQWNQFDPSQPFSYAFLDQELEQLYGSDQDQVVLIGSVALLCMILSGLGIMVLSAFTAAQNTKEIGIRRVIGASKFHIVILYFRRLLGTIGLSALAGSVLSYWLCSEWLKGFPYREEIELGVFFLGFLLVVILVFLTNSIQTFHAASINPSVALRRE